MSPQLPIYIDNNHLPRYNYFDVQELRHGIFVSRISIHEMFVIGRKSLETRLLSPSISFLYYLLVPHYEMNEAVVESLSPYAVRNYREFLGRNGVSVENPYEELFRELDAKFRSRLIGLAASYTRGDRSKALDLVQETFLAASRYYRPDRDITFGYLSRLLKYAAYRQWRDPSTAEIAVSRLNLEDEANFMDRIAATPASQNVGDLVELLDRLERKEGIDELPKLSQLSSFQIQLVRNAFVLGYTEEDIAKNTGMEKDAIHNQLILIQEFLRR